MDVTVVREPDRDSHGDIGEATEFTLSGCAAAPAAGIGQLAATGDRTTRASDTTREELTIFCADIDADVRSTDRIRHAGELYDVEGVPQRWENPITGTRAGCVFSISRTVG